MSTYYNDNDTANCAWLRELIREGCIPDGVVDHRDIQDIRPYELTPYTQQHFFAGIGGWALALRFSGWPDDQPVRTGSCPCQPFSCAGRGLGEKDPRHLWPFFRDLITFGEAAVTFGEQVASKSGREWLARVRADMEGLGYAFGAADLCAAGVGAPHIRQRLYWVAHPDSKRQSNAQGRKGSTWEAWRYVTTPSLAVHGVQRRIPSPEFCPVVNGFPAFPSIVRGYGNAIVPQVAAEFIRAYLESLQPIQH